LPDIARDRILPCFIACILALCAGSDTCWGLGAADILDRVQQRYAAGDFEADFIQEAHLKAMGMVDTAKGHLYFGSPGMMRWHYKSPEEYLIITDGDTVWLYRPEENQVMLGRAADYFGSRKGADFLSKPGELTREFVVELAPEERQDKEHYVLKLIPKMESPSLTELHLFISRKTFDITKIITGNAFGDRTIIQFESYGFERGLSSSLFVFEVPKGAEVLQLQGEQVGN
jgi:outer membrane lipoprotein carrier protein